MRLRIFLVFLLLPFFLNAQLQHRLGYAPFLKTFNPEKLAHALTDGLPDDSLKVRSLYLWMTHHISYDIRAFQLGSGSHTSPREILFYRKAVCLGYSILFDSLCTIAGIKAEVVPGYVYEPWYEARDTIYLDSHAWNVVQVDGEWKIIDVTWASGTIKMKRQYFRKTMEILFHVPYKQKLKYKRKRNDKYYFTPPEKFILDHMPSAPAWQLLDCTVPIDSFQWSPQAVQHYLDDPVNCKNGFDSIPKIANETVRREMIAEGKEAVNFNKHNHQDLALGYYVNGFLIYFDAIDTTKNYLVRMGLYDSVIVQMDSAAIAFNAAALDCKQEGAYFLRRNVRMKKQVLSENKPLLKKQSLEVTNIRRERSVARRTILHLEAQNIKLKAASKKMRRKKIDIERPEKPLVNEQAYRENLEDAIHANEDDIRAYEDSISSVTYNLHADEPPVYFKNLSLRKNLLMKELIAERNILLYREFYSCNSFDTLIINEKKIIFKYEKQRDSLKVFLRPAGKWVVDSSALLYNKYVKSMDVLIKENMKYCKELAKLNKAGFNEKDYFKDSRKKYIQWNDSLIAQNKLRIAAYKKYNESLDKTVNYYTASRNNLNQELRKENARVAGTNEFFKTYYGGNSNQMKYDARRCASIRKEAQREKKAVITKEQKRRKAALKKK